MESILSKVLFPDSYKIQGFYFIFFKIQGFQRKIEKQLIK